jgi:hypothetical protein
MTMTKRVAGAAITVACLLLPASASAEVLHDNIDLTSPQSINSQDFNAANDAFDAMVVDDFVVPAGQTWSVDSALVRGIQQGPTQATSANVKIFADAGGVPGGELFGAVASATEYPRMQLAFTPHTLLPGTYWFGASAILDPGTIKPFSQWYWAENSEPAGAPAMYRNPGNGFETGCTGFTVKSQCNFVTDDGIHLAPGQSFSLSGTRTVATPPPPTGDSAACITAKEKLDKAKAKLKKAKAKAADAKGKAKERAKAKVKKAKGKVKDAQAEVAERC